jgi:hypothetical protein
MGGQRCYYTIMDKQVNSTMPSSKVLIVVKPECLERKNSEYSNESKDTTAKR